MAKQGTIPTEQEIQALYNQAEKNPEAMERLADLSNKLAKRANERIRYLERHEMEGTAAYTRAQHYIQNSDIAKADKFSQSKKLDPADMAEQLSQITTFLRSQTSSAAGEKARRKRIIDSLVNNDVIGIPDEKSPTEINKWKKDFLDFLDTDVWKDIKKFLYTSTILNEASDAIANNAKLRDLKKAFDDYRNKGADTDLITIWDNWTSGNKYRRGKWINK